MLIVLLYINAGMFSEFAIEGEFKTCSISKTHDRIQHIEMKARNDTIFDLSVLRANTEYLIDGRSVRTGIVVDGQNILLRSIQTNTPLNTNIFREALYQPQSSSFYDIVFYVIRQEYFARNGRTVSGLLENFRDAFDTQQKILFVLLIISPSCGEEDFYCFSTAGTIKEKKKRSESACRYCKRTSCTKATHAACGYDDFLAQTLLGEIKTWNIARNIHPMVITQDAGLYQIETEFKNSLPDEFTHFNVDALYYDMALSSSII